MTEPTDKSTTGMSRRKALTRLGLGVAAAYTAPTVLHLDRSAQAVQPSCAGAGKGNPWCNKGKGGAFGGGKGNGKVGKGGK